MTNILLVGSDEPLLEGLAQALGALGHAPHACITISEARELAIMYPPLVAVIERAMAVKTGADSLGITLASGGAMVLYRASGERGDPLPYALQRQVLADLTLPLERHRLSALVQHVQDRAAATGKDQRGDPGDRASV